MREYLPARAVAFEVLSRVEQGGYASDLLLEYCADLESRDAGLASEIVFGVLRWQSQLDFLIEHFSGRGLGRLDPEVRRALRMGIYQIRYLDRVPRHAAVSESVELVKRARKRSAAGFVNAVLRKVHRDPVEWPDRAVELSHPEWLLARWERQFGWATARAIALSNLRRPETYIRVRPGDTVPPGAEPTDVSGCFRVTGQVTEGMVCMDIGSQTIVPLLELEPLPHGRGSVTDRRAITQPGAVTDVGLVTQPSAVTEGCGFTEPRASGSGLSQTITTSRPTPGLRFLDLCAAPGNKTAQALETGVRAVACDVHLHRLAPLKRLGIDLVQVDGTQPLPYRPCFDRILLDAPCTGTGTLARNPEIKWRLRPDDIADLHHRQRALLRQALAVLAPGGRLVYSTCSLETEENEAVVNGLAIASTHRIPGKDAGDGFFAAVVLKSN